MQNTKIPASELENLKFEYYNNEYVVALVDAQGNEIIKGYGSSVVDAINDMHRNLL